MSLFTAAPSLRRQEATAKPAELKEIVPKLCDTYRLPYKYRASAKILFEKIGRCETSRKTAAFVMRMRDASRAIMDVFVFTTVTRHN